MSFFAENPSDLSPSEPFGLRIELRWRNLVLTDQFKNFVKHKAGCGHSGAFECDFVSKEPFPLGLWGACHGHVKEGKIPFLRLILCRRPEGDPPERIARVSEALNGYPEGWNGMLEALKGQKGKCEAELTVYWSSKNMGGLKISPRKKKTVIPRFRLESETVTLVRDDGLKAHVAYGDQGFTFNIETELPELAILPTSIQAACEVLWREVKPLTKPKP